MSRLDRLADRANDTGDEAYDWVDERFDLDTGRVFLGKAFPAEDSFLLGEMALFRFLFLVLIGIFLGMFLEPSTSSVEYERSVAKFQDQEVSEAFASVLHIIYDIPLGIFIRRMHHWTAHLFVASIGPHMLRMSFTGAYRNPRGPNWVVGTGLAGLSMGATYTGYAFPFDEFAATTTGIGYNLATSIPLVGGVVGKAFFGGELPPSATIPRLYFLHVLVIPVTIGGLLAVHTAILVHQKHTEAPRDDDVRRLESRDRRPVEGSPSSDGGTEQTVSRDDDGVVVGPPVLPGQVAVSAVVFFLTLATLAMLAGFLPVHNIAEYGPNNPTGTPELIMPDWFLMWVYGLLRLLPSWMGLTVPLTDIHVSTELVGGVPLPMLVLGAVAVQPFAGYHGESVHFTADLLDRPWQTAVGVTVIQFIMIASIAGMNDLLGRAPGVGAGVANPILTAALFIVPIGSAAFVYHMLGDDADESRTGHVPREVDDDRREHRQGSMATYRTLASDVPTPRPRE